MRFTNYLRRLSRYVTGSRTALRSQKSARPRLAVERLEERAVPAARLYVDVGLNFPAGGLFVSDALSASVNGPAKFGSGHTLISLTRSLQTRGLDYDGNGTVNAADAVVLTNRVMDVLNRTLAPFDVQVQLASSASFPQIASTLGSSATNDAYLVVAGTPHPAHRARGWGPVDVGNMRDNAAFVFADSLLSDFGSADAVTALARVIAYEAAHTFGLEHTNGSILLGQGDEMGAPFDGRPDLRRYDVVNLFSRFPMPLQVEGVSFPQNSYSLLASNVGLRSSRPLYVTGTGAHDRITITRDNSFAATLEDQLLGFGLGVARVTVEAFADAAFTTPFYSYSYREPLRPGGMLVEAGVGADSILLDYSQGSLRSVTVRGGADADRLTVTATANADQITITSGQVLLGSSAITFAETESLTVDAGAGGDTIRVERTSSGVPVAVEAGAGDDTIHVGGPDFSVSVGSINGALAVDGGLGSDTLNFYDWGLSAGQTYHFSSTGLSRPGAGPISFSSIQNLQLFAGDGPDTININSVATFTAFTLYAGAGADTINVRSTAAFSVLTVNAGSGGDTVRIERTAASSSVTVNGGGHDDTVIVGDPSSLGPFHTLDGIQGLVTVRGNSGADALFVKDNALSAAGHTYTVTNDRVQRSGAAAIHYDDVEELEVRARPADDAINVQSTAAGTVTRIEAGGGNDTITVGRYVNLSSTPSYAVPGETLDQLQGTLILDGGSGTDGVTVRDTTNLAQAGKTYTLTALGVLHRFGTASILVSSVEERTLLSSKFNDLITVTGTAAGTATTIHAGAGHDSIDVWRTAAGSTLTVKGDAGSDALSLGLSVASSPLYPVAGMTMDQIQGPVEFQGGADFDTLAVLDTVNLAYAGKSYNVAFFSPASFQRAGAAITTFNSTVERLYLSTSRYDDTVTLSGLPGPDVILNMNAGNDTLVNWYLQTNNTFQVTGANQGDLNGKVDFTGTENLVGGDFADTFKFGPLGSVAGTVNGGGGTNTLDYSLHTAGVLVNLTNGSATGVAGEAPGKVSNIRNATGGSGDDILVGNAQANTLVGGFGRDLLIGGAGADVLQSSFGDDILIGGSTVHDANNAALKAIRAEWVRPLPFQERIAHLRNGGGLNVVGTTPILLNVSTVIDDLAADTLTSSFFLDWFWVGVGDTPTSGDQIN